MPADHYAARLVGGMIARVLFLSMHALDQMRIRGITRDEVGEAIVSRETVYPSKDDDEKLVVLGSTSAGRRLKVVVLRADPDYVVTAADRDRSE